jgi:cation diffusion facilitator family transporter
MADRNAFDAGGARYAEVRRVTLVGALVNLVVAVVKLVAGFVGQSQSLIADGFHSVADLASDFLVLFAAKHGSRAADADHPYGHGRIETMATVALGGALIVTGIGLGWDAVSRMLSPEALLHPGAFALAVAFLSVFAKEWVYQYTIRCARKLNSSLLKANAWHSRSDAIASVVAAVGIAGTMLGYTYLDAIAAVAVALMIAKIGWDLAWQGVHELIDTGLENEQVVAIRKLILSVDGVRAVHSLRSRRMGGGALVDVHVLVDPELSVSEGHFVSQTVHDRLVRDVAEVRDVLVHIDPEDDEASVPTNGLPGREEVLARLRPHWAEIPGTERIEKTTLHYLDGKVLIEVALPLAEMGSIEAAQRFSRALINTAIHAPEVGSIRVYFQ